MARFWWSWPSWLVEAISGVLLFAAVFAPARLLLPASNALLVVVASAIALELSLGYELIVDPNGWEKRDLIPRTIAQLVAAGLALLLL